MNNTAGSAAPQGAGTEQDTVPSPPPDTEPGEQGANDTTPLVVRVGDHVQSVLPTDLADPDLAEQIRAAAEQANQPAIFEVHDLIGWPDTARWDVMRTAWAIRPHSRIRHRGSSTEHETPFDAVLAGLVGDEDVTRCENGRRAALEAAVLVHPNALGTACSRIANRLRELGVAGVRADALLRQARELADGLAAKPAETSSVPVRDVLHDAPVPEAVVVPQGWTLTPSGISRVGQSVSILIPAPVIVATRLHDVAEGTEAMRLAWTRDGHWKRHDVERAVAANGRSIVDLAGRGLPVTSNNAKDLVQYLADFEAENLSVLPISQVSRQMGWQGHGGVDGFLWGHTLITAATPVHGEPLAATPDGAGQGAITFHGADDGDEQLAGGFRASGTFEGWRQAVAIAAHYPRIRLAIFAALAPPVLALLDSPNFGLDYAGETSRGKTTTLRVAASAWGSPDERSPAAALSTWDATRVWIERASAVLNNLPLILDDTKRAKKRQDVAQTLYDVASGRGRGRGSPRGMARAGTWTTVLISSGEAPATGFTEDGGTRARVLTLWGSPFGQADAATAQVVHQLNLGVRAHHGHAGPRLVGHLIENRAQWDACRQQYHDALEHYTALAGANPVAARMAAHFAALVVTARLAHEALDLPWSFQDPVEPLYGELVAETPDADPAARALRHVVSWAQGHQEEFFGRRDEGRGQPHAGWAGRWDVGGPTHQSQWTYIGFLPDRLKVVLAEGGFEPDPVVRGWKERGWLLIDASSGKARYRARVGEENPWLVAVNRQAIDEVE